MEQAAHSGLGGSDEAQEGAVMEIGHRPFGALPRFDLPFELKDGVDGPGRCGELAGAFFKKLKQGAQDWLDEISHLINDKKRLVASTGKKENPVHDITNN